MGVEKPRYKGYAIAWLCGETLSLIQSPCLIMMFPLGLRGCEKLNKEGFLEEISPGILKKWHGRD